MKEFKNCLPGRITTLIINKKLVMFQLFLCWLMHKEYVHEVFDANKSNDAAVESVESSIIRFSERRGKTRAFLTLIVFVTAVTSTTY